MAFQYCNWSFQTLSSKKRQWSSLGWTTPKMQLLSILSNLMFIVGVFLCDASKSVSKRCSVWQGVSLNDVVHMRGFIPCHSISLNISKIMRAASVRKKVGTLTDKSLCYLTVYRTRLTYGGGQFVRPIKIAIKWSHWDQTPWWNNEKKWST